MLPLDIILSRDEGEQYNDLTQMYSDIADAFNGVQRNWSPVVIGGTTDGVGTYTTQTGYCYRIGLMVDCWFYLTLTAHTGTGDMIVKLPYKIKRSEDIWPGVAVDSNLTHGGTKVSLLGINDTNTLKIISSGAAAASSIVQIDGACSLTGHIRYVGQAKELR